MTHRPWKITALSALIIATLAVTGAVAAEKKDKPENHLGKRLDLEIGGPAFVGIVSGAQPIKDGYWLQFGGAYHFLDNFAVEAYGAWGTGEARFSLSPTLKLESDQTVWSGFGGLRWYLLGKRGAPARFYMAAGAGVIFNYVDDSQPFDPTNPPPGGLPSLGQETSAFAYIAPGVRLQAGNRSGFLIRVPFNMTFKDIDSTFVTPGLAAFISF
ncbi:MAG: hypothetical protein V3R77_02855 [Candidatus Binatia bacterium]